ncbi:MAG: OadG family protein [Treponema sp.]|jgi:oxaloacetate decarboxylase gamma subunit|nr:OadG family protein [Treponema sp.]
MTIIEMIGQSGILTMLGVGIVFGFLGILVAFITLIGRIINAFGMKAVRPAAAVAQNPGTNNGISAAIGAAVNQYRKNN